ncbi:hypothetical protein PGO_093590 [Plasmodium gonderi]|uniref:Uncharacterized protein n=1 Tax=Plasmodium gonderi TaxID=77519 RepID=A0A1Y1JF42_PLAGO|nr:hypothetical protein PGO_093590 [Plasmodium gonderi]GAW81159.1 hypothetical protein PGO_093590 [Plasmodium gonderi]
MTTKDYLNELNFPSYDEDLDLKIMENKNMKTNSHNSDSGIDSEKENFIDCFETIPKRLHNKDNEFFLKNDTIEECKKLTYDNPCIKEIDLFQCNKKKGSQEYSKNDDYMDDNCGDDHDLTKKLETFQSFDLSTSDIGDKELSESEANFQNYNINLKVDSDISINEKKSFNNHGIEVREVSEENKRKSLSFYGGIGYNKELADEDIRIHSLYLENNAENEMNKKEYIIEKQEGFTRSKDMQELDTKFEIKEYSDEEEEKNRKIKTNIKENSNQKKVTKEEDAPNDIQIDRDIDNKEMENDARDEIRMNSKEKAVKDSEELEKNINTNYNKNIFKKEHMQSTNLTNEKRKIITLERNQWHEKVSFSPKTVIMDDISYQSCVNNRTTKRGDDVEEQLTDMSEMDGESNIFDSFKKITSTFNHYTRGNIIDKEESQKMDKIINKATHEKDDILDSRSSKSKNSTDNFNQNKNQNFSLKLEESPNTHPPNEKKNNLNILAHRIPLKVPMIREQYYNNYLDECKITEKKKKINREGNHYNYRFKEQGRGSRNYSYIENFYKPVKQPKQYGEYVYRYNKINTFKNVGRRTIGTQKNFIAGKKHDKKMNIWSELCITKQEKKKKKKIPEFKLKPAEIKNFDFDAIFVKDGHIIPRKIDPLKEFFKT